MISWVLSQAYDATQDFFLFPEEIKHICQVVLPSKKRLFFIVIDLVTTKEEIHFTVLRNLRPIYQRDICTENIKKRRMKVTERERKKSKTIKQ